MQLRILEAGQECVHVSWGEHLQVRRIMVRWTPAQELQPVLEPVRVRHRRDEGAARPQYAADLADDALRVAQVLEQLPGDDHVEALVAKLERLVEVGPVRLDPELRRLLERLAVGVDADNFVSVRVGPRQRAVAAAEVEHAPARPADVAPEQLDAFLACVDETGASLDAIVFPVSLAELFESHGFTLAVHLRR